MRQTARTSEGTASAILLRSPGSAGIEETRPARPEDRERSQTNGMRRSRIISRIPGSSTSSKAGGLSHIARRRALHARQIPEATAASASYVRPAWTRAL